MFGIQLAMRNPIGCSKNEYTSETITWKEMLWLAQITSISATTARVIVADTKIGRADFASSKVLKIDLNLVPNSSMEPSGMGLD